jgi:hypothetical protein
MAYNSKAELQKIYKKVDLNKFFKHYHAKVNNCGNELRMCCILPGHKDSSPSASFNIDKMIYNCYVCGGRNFFKLVQELESLKSFGASIEFVKKMIGYESDEVTQIDNVIDELNDVLNEEGIEHKKVEYIEIDFSKYPEFEDASLHFIKVKKRVSHQMIKLWNLKYAVSGYYKDRLIIPITVNNRVMSFAARDMTGKANTWLKILSQAKKDKLTVTEIAELKSKYECKKILYPPVFDKVNGVLQGNIIYGSPIQHLLFNYDNAVQTGKDYVILVEGVFDCMRLFAWGFNAVALCGTKLSAHNRSLLLKQFDRIYIALDNDIGKAKNAGQESAQAIKDSLYNRVDVYNIVLPPNKDPDECTREEFAQYFADSDNSDANLF